MALVIDISINIAVHACTNKHIKDLSDANETRHTLNFVQKKDRWLGHPSHKAQLTWPWSLPCLS